MVTYRRRRVRRRAGRGFMDVLRKAHNFIKSNKLVSRVASALGAAGLPYAGAIGNAASALGYGRRYQRRPRRRVGGRVRRVRRRRAGRGLRDILAKAHGFIKRNQLVSKGLSHFNHPKLASAASALGYGRRRRVRRSRRVGGSSVHQVARIKFA